MTEVVYHPAVRSKPRRRYQGLIRLAIIYAFFALWWGHTAHNMLGALAENPATIAREAGINVVLSQYLAEDWSFHPENHLELCKVYGMNPDAMWALIMERADSTWAAANVSDDDRPTMDGFFPAKCAADG